MHFAIVSPATVDADRRVSIFLETSPEGVVNLRFQRGEEGWSVPLLVEEPPAAAVNIDRTMRAVVIQLLGGAGDPQLPEEL